MSQTRITKLQNVEILFEDALEEFLLFMQEKGRAAKTIDDYRWHCSRFYKLFPHFPDVDLLKQSSAPWLAEKVSPYTYNLRLTYNKRFFQYCVEQGYLDDNPLRNYSVKKTEPRIVQNDQLILIKLLKQPDTKTYVGLRDYAMMLMTLDTGIRPSELRKLMPEAIDLKNGNVLINSEISKSRNSRLLPLQPITVAVLKRLIANRPSCWKRSPLFSTNEGTEMSARAWQDRIKLYGGKIGIKLKPYDLRHDFALLYLKNGGNVFTLQKMMGHSTLEMTRRYIDIDNSELKRMAEVASPLNVLISVKRRI